MASTTKHNPDIRNAYSYLLGNRHIKKQTDVVKATGYPKGYTSDILNGKVNASEEFREAFEATLLHPLRMTLKKFVKVIEVDPVAEEYATEHEALYAKLVYLEKFDIQLLDVVIMVLANQIGEEAADKIKDKIYDNLGVKKPKASPAPGAKKKKAVS